MDRGAGKRSALVPLPPADVPDEPPKTNTAATMPMASAVSRFVPAGARQWRRTTVPFRLVYPLMNGKAEAPSLIGSALSRAIDQSRAIH
ncbi:hypothetical protein ACFWV1_10785 [Streptomyces sp. NPDC058700]|uniref:hypothetical protein n=1 Tax=Streptomyces sp. NPDC058700 TaxID=3346607 RepID=UPI00365675F8